MFCMDCVKLSLSMKVYQKSLYSRVSYSKSGGREREKLEFTIQIHENIFSSFKRCHLMEDAFRIVVSSVM